MYRLAAFVSSDGKNSFPSYDRRESVQGVFPARSKAGDSLAIIRQGLYLNCFKYDSNKWTHLFEEKVFGRDGQYPLNSYPWMVSDKIRTDESMIVLKHPDGIQIFSIDMTKPGLTKLSEDGLFHDVNQLKLLWGNFFPQHPNWLSVMSRNKRNVTKFRAYNETSFDPANFEDGDDPSFGLKTVDLTPIWHATNAEFLATDLKKSNIDVIGVRDTDENMEFYEFNESEQLDQVLKTTQIPRSTSDKLFFVNLSKQAYKDILHLNDSGLFTYEYDKNDYKFISFNGDFSQSSGWSETYTETVKAVDIDNDECEDLIFTGQRGLKAIKFDAAAKKWTDIVKADGIDDLPRYANVVGVFNPTSAITYPSVFVQDDAGVVYWSEIIGDGPPPTSSTSTSTQSSITTTTEDPANVLIPDEMPRSFPAEKPTLKWTEQWDENFIKDPVDLSSGQVRFNLPLIDISSATGWGLQMPLAYHSSSSNADYFGSGWAMPLAADFIFVDYQGSIYDQEAKFSLVTMGSMKQMKLIDSSDGVDYYEVIDDDKDDDDDKDEEKVKIAFYKSEKRWVIDGKLEQAIYGTPGESQLNVPSRRVKKTRKRSILESSHDLKSNKPIRMFQNLRSAQSSSDTNAIQFALGWNNWHGAGRDQNNLQQYPVAWYLSRRYSKITKKSLHYQYESDTKSIGSYSYTSAMRLKSIRDDANFKLNFDYTAKSSNEFDESKAVDEDGNIFFPISLEQSKYVASYDIVTSTYQQKFNFVYEVNNDKRNLMGIQQNNEDIFKFTYTTKMDKTVLASCKLPRGSTVNFEYNIITTPNPIDITTYAADDNTKIAYGIDFGVLAYIRSGKIAVQITNREMTRLTIDCETDLRFKCPQPSGISKILMVKTYKDSFVIFAENSSGNRYLFFYERSKKKWSLNEDQEFYIEKDSTIGISEIVIAVASKKENSISLFIRGDKWKNQKINLPRKITRLALADQVVAAYDDSQLMIFTRDLKDVWQMRVLQSNLDDFRAKFDDFNVVDDLKKNLTIATNQGGLQIMNNLISLSSIYNENDVMKNKINMYLLDGNYGVGKSQTLNFNRENLMKLENGLDDKDNVTEEVKSTFYTQYYKDKNLYNIHVTRVTGEAVKEINEIENDNKREDAMKEFIKSINEAEDWIKMFKESILYHWNYYSTQMTQQGVVYGNDTMIRMTGNEFKSEKLDTSQKIKLSKDFTLEPTDDDKKIYNLYKNNAVVRTFKLLNSGELLNRYPSYIAYHEKENEVKVSLFKDEKTLGDELTFDDEYLTADSDYQNLVTKRNSTGTQELLIRPSSTFVRQETYFVSEFSQSVGDVVRTTGYERAFKHDEFEKKFIETMTIVPGGNKALHGRYEAISTMRLTNGNTTSSDRYFNANGEEIYAPVRREDDDDKDKEDEDLSPSKIYDMKDRWIISDFTPYNVTDEIGAYYGFEDYEKNKIGSSKSWDLSDADVVRDGFAFTGNNYLRLKSSSSSLKGVFQPAYQSMPYLAACWIRTSQPLEIDAAVPYLKALLSTKDAEEFVGLQAQVKNQIGDWFYLEVAVDLNTVEHVYRKYKEAKNIQSNEDPKYKITLKIETFDQDVIDVDHIRFTPVGYEFYAVVFDDVTGAQRAFIQSNGQVLKTIYNNLQQPIANINDDGQVESLTTTNSNGKLSVSGSKINSQPNVVTFEPEDGFYETFDEFAFKRHWKIDDVDGWKRANGQLWHKSGSKHVITARDGVLNMTSTAMRFYLSLSSSNSQISINFNDFGAFKFSRQSDNSVKLTLPNNESITNLPSSTEVIVMVEENFALLWINGILIVDQKFSQKSQFSSFAMEMQGDVLIEDFFVMSRPRVRVEYQNEFSDKTQVIQLESIKSAMVTETLYDTLGREAINTKTTRIERSNDGPLLAYRDKFITNRKTVWNDQQIAGEVNDLNQNDNGFAFTRVEYAANPLNEKIALGMPGKQFAINSAFAVKTGSDSKIAFMSNLFPSKNGFRQKFQQTPNGSQSVVILDKNENEVCKYERVRGTNHLLSTYEFDEKNRLVKILPPLYHEKVNTDVQLTPYQPGDDHLTDEQKYWQEKLATRYVYNDDGQIVKKVSPESGHTHYLYNDAGRNRFTVSYGNTSDVQQILFYDHDMQGQVIRTGHLKDKISIDDLGQYMNNYTLPETAQVYQEFHFTDDHFDPLQRSRVKYLMTHNEDFPVIENLQFDARQQVMSKSALAPDESEENFEIKKEFVRDRVRAIKYPVKVNGQPLELIHTYNRLGKLVGLGTESKNYVSFDYNPGGHLINEKYDSGLNREYIYNSPGYLEKISDKFITEDILYTQKGYAQDGFGDGMVMQMTFKANWIENADPREFQLKASDLKGDYGEDCIQALKRAGYLSASGQPLKMLTKDIETTLPTVCDERDIAEKMAQKMPPKYHGYRMTYGNHQELLKAKFLTTDTEDSIDPLQTDSFSKDIEGLTIDDSQNIWNAMVNKTFIIPDSPSPDFMIGKQGKYIFQHSNLNKDLIDLNNGGLDYITYTDPIEKLIVISICDRKTIIKDDFVKVFLLWNNLNDNSPIITINKYKKIGEEIFGMLGSKKYLPNYSNINDLRLDEDFKSSLSKYTSKIPEIVKTLTYKFAYALGQAPFDTESYAIDSNGNHHKFYTGFNRYELNYPEGSNQIESIKLGSATVDGEAPTYKMKHDIQGNVVQAQHVNIDSIEYHPVSQRMTRIKLDDGRLLRFSYDAKGERVLKQVYSGKGDLMTEKRYLRDESGRVMLDQKTTYSNGDSQTIDTAYVYGPRGLLGFVRKDEFYSVTLDHSGSVRLVSRGNDVVAAYDYLPYGQLMRSYGSDPLGHIDYRYTGQEFDDETGLYNYHARMYDPIIGRFYQVDPKAQYFSPYKYAGNSPISVIDPDGEFAFLLFCLIFAIVGAYLGGAAANNRWNPLQWDWSDKGTWLGIVGGGIGGALLPVGFVASVGAIGVIGTVGLGAAFAYGSAAAAAGSWDPSKWNWDQPGTWNALFSGFATGSGVAGGIKGIYDFATEGAAMVAFGKLVGDATARAVFISVTITSGVGLAYGMGVMANQGNPAFWEWDWSNPSTFYALIDGFNSGITWPQAIMEMTRGINKVLQDPKRLGSMLSENPSRRTAMLAVLKNPKHALYKVTFTALMGYLMGAAENGSFDPANWNWSFSTYAAVINGAFMGKGFSQMFKSPADLWTHLYDVKSGTYYQIWSKDFAKMLEQYLKLSGKWKANRAIERMFALNNHRMNFIAHINDRSLKAEAENFFNGDILSWREGRVIVSVGLSAELQNLIKKNDDYPESVYNRVKVANERMLNEQQIIYPDRDVSYLSCDNGCHIATPEVRSRKPFFDISRYEVAENKTRSKRSADDEKIIYVESQPIAKINTTWNKFIGIFSRADNQQQAPKYSPNSISVDEYTNGHFNGLLQLLDLFIRKQTGEKYSHKLPSHNSDLDYAERCLKASENAAKYIEAMENGENDEIMDEYECYEAIMRGEEINADSVPQVAYSTPNMQRNNYHQLN